MNIFQAKRDIFVQIYNDSEQIASEMWRDGVYFPKQNLLVFKKGVIGTKWQEFYRYCGVFETYVTTRNLHKKLNMTLVHQGWAKQNFTPKYSAE